MPSREAEAGEISPFSSQNIRNRAIARETAGGSGGEHERAADSGQIERSGEVVGVGANVLEPGRGV